MAKFYFAVYPVRNLPSASETLAIGKPFALPTANKKFAIGKCAACHRQNFIF